MVRMWLGHWYSVSSSLLETSLVFHGTDTIALSTGWTIRVATTAFMVGLVGRGVMVMWRFWGTQLETKTEPRTSVFTL